MGDQVHDRSLLGELYLYKFFNWVAKVNKGHAKFGKIDQVREGIFDYIE